MLHKIDHTVNHDGAAFDIEIRLVHGCKIGAFQQSFLLVEAGLQRVRLAQGEDQVLSHPEKLNKVTEYE